MLGYTFPGSLSQEQLALRRWLLDEYADQAQFTTVVALICLSIPRWLPSVRQRLGLKHEEKSILYSRQTPLAERYRLAWRQIQWGCGNRCKIAGYDLGTFGEVIGSLTWLLWLLHLCTANTGGDYLHLTKRFGIVGASQIPLQLLMAMKPSWSPVQLITRKGHEELKAWHQNLGRIIQLLLSLHAIFYLNFYVQMGLLSKRIKDSDVQIGLAGISILTALGILASTKVRAWNYRIFFTSHIYLAMAFLPLMYFHVKQIQTYMIESLAIQLINVASWKFYTSKHVATVKVQPKTGLIKLDVPARTLKWIPGQHVYLTLAPRPTSFGRNPFTVASLPDTDGRLTLAMRILNGNTKKLARIVQQKKSVSPDSDQDHIEAEVEVELEGPYGASRHLPDLSQYHTVLLVAGGVGASYIIPIWRSLLRKRSSEHSAATLHMIWTVRNLAETDWALPIPELEALRSQPDDSRLDIYVSGASSEAEIDRFELKGDDRKSQLRTHRGVDVLVGRPHFESIVGDYIESLDRTDKVAVLVCGPPGMSEDLRGQVGVFVDGGQDVFWHAEEFGFGS